MAGGDRDDLSAVGYLCAGDLAVEPGDVFLELGDAHQGQILEFRGMPLRRQRTGR